MLQLYLQLAVYQDYTHIPVTSSSYNCTIVVGIGFLGFCVFAVINKNSTLFELSAAATEFFFSATKLFLHVDTQQTLTDRQRAEIRTLGPRVLMAYNLKKNTSKRLTD